MRLAHDLLVEDFLSSIRVASQVFQLLLIRFWLRYPNLPFDSRLYCVLEFCLYCLGSPQYVSELLGKSVMNCLLDPSLWLVLLGRFTLFYINLHHRQICFDPLEIFTVRIDELVDHIGLNWNR